MKNLTEAELKFCMFQTRRLGSFYTALIEAIMRADKNNTEKLRKAFPELVEVVWRFHHEEGYWSDLSKRFATKINK